MNPEELRFAKTHEWLATDGTVGISDHAQKEITDVVYVEPPKVGKAVKAGDSCAVIESVKAAFDIYAPVSGTIEAVNDAVGKDPTLVNKSAYEKGWLFRIKPSAPAERDALMAHAAYQEFIKTAAH